MHAQAIRLSVLSVLLTSPAVSFAQPVERGQDLEPFTTIELQGCFDTRLAAGAQNRITVSATPEQHDAIRIEQDGDTVTVEPKGWDNGWSGWCRGSTVQILVTANFAKDGPVELRLRGSGDLDAEVPAAATLAASVAGSGDLTLRGSAGECELTVSGSGDITARALECATSTEVAVHGSGDATLQGKTKSCSFEVHGSGDVAASSYACDSAEVEINGSGSVGLSKVVDLSVEIHGSGDVSYGGAPQLRRMSIHGSGEIHQL